MAARSWYRRRIEQMAGWLAARRQCWTATDWDIAGAVAMLRRALAAEERG